MSVKFSVIMPTYNRGKLIKSAIDSVLQQSHGDFELIIIDDHSDTPASEAYPIIKDHPKIIYRYLERNKGVSAARNIGIHIASGSYLSFLDDDDTYHREKLAVIGRAIKTQPADIYYHKMIIHLVDERFSYLSAPYPAPFSLQELLMKNLLGGPSMVVVRKEACDTVHGFDETLPDLEDYELWIRLAKAGYKFQYIDAPLANYYRRTKHQSRSLAVDKDVTAWQVLHDLYKDDYSRFTESMWSEHRQKIYLFRAFRSVLGYQRTRAFRYFVRAFIAKPSLPGISLPLIGGLALLSPKHTLILQGKFKRNRLVQSFYLPSSEGTEATSAPSLQE